MISQPVRLDRFIATAKRLVESDNPLEQAAGLLAVTGRRFSEIVSFGTFGLTQHPYAIAFKGQLKKGILDVNDVETFSIATLIEAKDVMEALERFRRDQRIKELKGLDPDKINSKLNTSVRHHIKREFQNTGLVPVLKGEKAVSAHNLRGVYGTIAIRFFCPATQNPHRFIQAHLGHIIGERELDSRKNASATEHYFHYYLVGAQNQMLGERGILLEQVGGLPTTVGLTDEPIEEPTEVEVAVSEPGAARIAAVEIEDTQVEQVHTETMTKTKIGKGQKRARTSVAADLMNKMRAIASLKFGLGKDATNSEVMEATISFLASDDTPQISQSINSLGATMQWFTSEMDRLRKDNERLQSKVDSITVERDLAVDEVERLREEDLGDGIEMEVIKEENASLRNELQQFYQLKQLLSGGSSNNGESPGVTATASPAPVPETPVPLKNKRVQDENEAISHVERAISRIMKWNDNEQHTFNDKWFISTPALQDLLRGSGYTASQPRVKAALDYRRHDIDQHHANHGLGSRHNRKHQYPITNVMTLE